VWEIEFADGEVTEHIRQLDPQTRQKVLRVLTYLEQNGNRLGMPHSRALGDGLFELRTSGRKPQRLYYGFKESRIYIVNHGKENQQAAIELARERLKKRLGEE
jgi:hypothetical protein